MEPENSLPYSQVSATSPYPEPTQSPQPHPTSWRSILILSSHLRLGLTVLHKNTIITSQVLTVWHCPFCSQELAVIRTDGNIWRQAAVRNAHHLWSSCDFQFHCTSRIEIKNSMTPSEPTAHRSHWVERSIVVIRQHARVSIWSIN